MNFSKLTKKQQETLMSSTGVLIIVGIVLVINFLFLNVPLRFDLTEYEIYTLSDGTREVVKKLDVPVKIQYYVTDTREMMSAEERSFSRSVENTLIEYEKLSRNVVLEKLNPEPDTDAEEAAVKKQLALARGREGQIYRGIVVTCIDKEEIIPYVGRGQEQTLEYDVTSAIARVSQEDDEKPMVTLMTSLSVTGGFSGNFQAPPQEPWYFYRALEQDYQVQTIEADAKEIPEDTDVLVVFHPYDTSEAGEYAIDQYLMKGGHVMVLVDPRFWASMAMGQPSAPGMPPQGGPGPSSNLPTLFDAWGVTYSASQVLADQYFAVGGGGGQEAVTSIVRLSQDAMNRENVVTSRLNHVLLPLPGGFEVVEKKGLQVTPLLVSSPENQLIDAFQALPDESLFKMQEEFTAHGESRSFALQLKGMFPSAFPDGNPAGEASPEDEEAADQPEAGAEGDEAAEGDEKKEDSEEKAEAEDAPKSLKKAEKEGVVMLIADVDFLYQDFALTSNPLTGPSPANHNIALFMGMTEVLSGNDSLVNLRARVSTLRPFNKLRQMERKAEAQVQEQLLKLQQEEQELMEQIDQAFAQQMQGGEDGEETVIELDITDLRLQEVETSRQIAELRKELKKDVDRYVNKVKIWNIAAVPLLVIAVGLIVYGQRRSKIAAK